MKVQEIMTRDVESCSPETNLAAAAMMMWRTDCGVIPVRDGNGEVRGLITDRDICMAVATQHRLADEIRVGEVMTGRVHAVKPGDDVTVAAERMRSERVRRLPVVDDEGRLAGVVSINDLVLNADSSSRARRDRISTEDVMSVLRAVCGHRPAGDERSQGATVTGNSPQELLHA